MPLISETAESVGVLFEGAAEGCGDVGAEAATTGLAFASVVSRGRAAAFAAGRGCGFTGFGSGCALDAAFGAGFGLGLDRFGRGDGFFDAFGGDFFAALAAGRDFEGFFTAFGVAFACFFAMRHHPTPLRS
ncbi:MAG: hypothetical protein HYU52_02380 [Acidobacteria bacterium]|nr:hypothetical protein [Acidobacteriota bacterium]